VPPSELFRRLRERNPAPYGALLNLGTQEYLVAASPEMYVRVDGRRIETCPISGTIARGKDAIEDAGQILELLNSEKETAELTMCTDVDRNDKSRVCEPGTVKVIGRRQIEMYSRLIHTVDHVEGQLADDYDALDGFLAHTWAVTVTGAPKHAAIQFIEDNEHSPRGWYGGAIGLVGFDGNMNTGLTLRTMRIKDGISEVRAGATLLFDSDPEAEEAETRLKASALIDAIRRGDQPASQPKRATKRVVAARTRILMIDHRDSFVHTLASYLREYAGEVTTLRPHLVADAIDSIDPDLVVLSPGPGIPDDFAMRKNIGLVLARGKPIFGVCLGLQGIVEYFGGTLATLGYPMHGKPSVVTPLAPSQSQTAQARGSLFDGLPASFVAGRYHSLFADKATFPSVLGVTATTADGTIMAIEHESLPIAAVQFHPESILTLEGRAGHRLIENVIGRYAAPAIAGGEGETAVVAG
jgi:anthranilate synthase